MEKIDLSVGPFYDDFDESKNFHRILFRPGFAVQGRELTQLQTIIQKQIERFGSHVFKDGSPVSDGQTNVFTDITYLKLESTFGGLVLNVDSFDGLELVETTGRGARARVIAVAEESADPPTFMVRYVSGEEFLPSDTLALATAPSVGVAKIRSESNSIGKGSIATIQEGIFFIRGFFVHTPQQVVILDKYGVSPTYDVGLEITEAVITDRDDTTLLDPALEASNFQAPGAARLAINLVYNKRTTSSTDLTEFVKLLKVENGQIVEWIKYPIYNELEKTLARRTYDESGNYTVRAFRASISEDSTNNAQYVITLDPGKAYVFGYEFETIAPTKIQVPKPRVRSSINNYALAMNYGNFVWTTHANGFFNTSLFPEVDLHLATANSIDFANSTVYANTKIGTARIRDFAFESAGVTSQSNTYVYRAHLFDVNTVNYTGNSAGTNSTSRSINLASGYSATVNIFQGVIITLTGGPGVGDRRTVASYDGTTKIATILATDSDFSATPTAATQYQLSFQFKDVEAIAIRQLAATNVAADVQLASKDATTTFDDSILRDTAFDQLIFQLPYNYIVPTDAANSIVGISDVSYQYRKVFTPTLTSNVASLNLSGVEQFVGSAGAQSTLEKLQNWIIEINSPSGSTYGKGAIVAENGVTITISGTQTANVTIPNGGNSAVAITALVNVTGGGRKTKTKVLANTTVIAAAGAQLAYDKFGVVVPGVNVYSAFGQVDFNGTAVIPKTSDTDLMAFIPDGIRLKKVVQSPNTSAAVSATDLVDASKDITDRYTFDNGQRNGYYDHARIRLKPGVRPPTGQLRVFLDYYDHDLNQGYFSVDSYPNANNQTGYAEIPLYQDTAGKIFYLRDCIDFRPRKTIAYANTFASPVYIAASSSNFNLDFAYYLARIDHLVLSRSRKFEVVEGVDALIPTVPKNRDDAMLLNTITMPPYVTDAPNVCQLTSTENRRYTMRDIGALEKRIENIEYYTMLSLLERATLATQDSSILDDIGLERTKNGIIVDSFVDFSAGQYDDPEWRSSIDLVNHRLKPAFTSENYDVFFSANTSTQAQLAGHLVMLPFTDNTAMIVQNVASKAVNINPFNVTRWLGSVGIAPPHDTWIDTRLNLIVTNPYAGMPITILNMLWERWSVLYSGQVQNSTTASRSAAFLVGAAAAGINERSIISGPTIGDTSQNPHAPGNIWQFEIANRQASFTVTEFEEVRTSSGTRVLSSTMIPYIRSRAVNFSSKNLRPNTNYYAYFDSVDVTNYIQRGNIIRLTSTPVSSGQFTEEIQDTYGVPDILLHYDNYAPASVNLMGTSILLTYAANVGVTVPSKTTQGVPDSLVALGPQRLANTTNNAVVGIKNLGGSGGVSGLSYRIATYEHYSGNVVAGTGTTLTISNSAHSNASFYAPSIGMRSWANLAAFSPAQWAALGNDSIVRIVSGKGAGQTRSISAYALATNQFTVTLAWTTIPDGTSIYSIGQPRSVETGHMGGVFFIPNTASVQFRTGDRVLKLTDSSVNNDNLASTFATGRYSASGTLQEVQENVMVTRRVKKVSEFTVSDNYLRANFGIYTDPLAQSFVVDARQYPNGVFLSKVRFCFQTRDTTLPVRLQVRSMVNGIPNSKDFIDEVVVNPQYVQVTSTPNISNSTKYTEFKFATPIYLAAGAEYALVLLSDSNQYTVWTSEMGQTDVVTGAVISKQPTLGSLFKSQNGSTWTPVQEEDLMFSMHICQFDTTKTANASILLYPLSANANVDLFYFSAVGVSPPQTEVDFAYVSELKAGGYTAPRSFIPNMTTYFDDVLGRRVFRSGTNGSMQVYATMTTSDPWVSPGIDISAGLSVFGIEHSINNGELSNLSLILTNGGSGYLTTDNSNITISITGGGGSGAQAQVNAISNGVVQDIIMTNPGLGYYTTPIITLGFTGNAAMRTANTNVAAVLTGETSAHGGNAFARYIMRKVTLSDGFDSSDIRVYLTSYKPVNSQILVYYKVLSNEDTDVWDNQPWTVMTQLGNTLVTSKTRDDFIELTYAPGTGGVASKEILYNGFSTFRHFAIKVVTFTTNPTDVPEFRDIRVIALPSGKVA